MKSARLDLGLGGLSTGKPLALSFTHACLASHGPCRACSVGPSKQPSSQPEPTTNPASGGLMALRSLGGKLSLGVSGLDNQRRSTLEVRHGTSRFPRSDTAPGPL